MWLPPILLEAARRRPSGGWEYRPSGWSGAGGEGWNAAGVAAAQRANWDAFLALTQGCGPLGINHTDLAPHGESPLFHNLSMTFGYALARAAAGRDQVSILDWGGGAGHYYRLAQALLPGVRVDYTCHDVPVLCRLGRELNPGARFEESAEAALEPPRDLVLASGSLHYSQDWSATLANLAHCTTNLLLVTRLPTVLSTPSFVVVQRAHDCGYNTEYQGWFLNLSEFLASADASGLVLEREVVVDERPVVPGAPEQCLYRGFLFHPRVPPPAAGPPP